MHRLLFATLVTVPWLAACNKLDTRDVGNKAKQIGEDRVGPVASVSCPDAKRKKGVTFKCQVKFVNDDTPRDLRFTLIDDNGGFEAEFDPRIVGGERLATFVAEGILENQPELGNPAVDCGLGVVEVPEEGVTCHLVAGDLERDLIVHVSDDDAIDWTVKP